MALFTTSANYIENTQKAEHDAQRFTNHEGQAESGSLKMLELSSKIVQQLKSCKSYSVNVEPAKKINGYVRRTLELSHFDRVWTFSLNVTAILSTDGEFGTPTKNKHVKWTVSRHYNQFRYIFDSISANNHLKV